MSRLSALCCFALAVAPLAACTDTETDEPVTTDPAAASYTCVNLGTGFGIHDTICNLARDPIGFQLTPPSNACPAIHVINQCGDNCCDVAETLTERYCAADCNVGMFRLVTTVENKPARLYVRDRLVGTVDRTGLAVSTVEP